MKLNNVISSRVSSKVLEHFSPKRKSEIFTIGGQRMLLAIRFEPDWRKIGTYSHRP